MDETGAGDDDGQGPGADAFVRRVLDEGSGASARDAMNSGESASPDEWPAIRLADHAEVSDPICSHCGAYCYTNEVVFTGYIGPGGPRELWCYCQACDLDSFHPIYRVSGPG